MAGEERYINPIIEAMARTANMAQERRRLAAEQENAQADRKIRQQLADQAEEQIKNTAEHNKALIDLQNKHFQLAHDEHALNAIQIARNLVAGGVKLPQVGGENAPAVPGMPAMSGGPGTIQIPGTDVTLPANALPGPEEVAKQKANEITAEGEARWPFQLRMLQAEEQSKGRLQKNAQDFEAAENTKKEANQMAIAKMSRGTQFAIAQMETNARKDIFGLEHGLTPEGIRSGIMQGLTGQRKFTSDNVYDQNVMRQINALGARPLDPKDAETLKSLNGLNDAFDKMQKFINDNLSDSKMGAFATGLKAKIPQSDIKSRFDTVKSYALNIGKALEAQTGGRVLSKQLDLDLDSMVSPGITKSNAQAKLDDLRDRYVNQVQNVIMTGMPDFQKEAIQKTYDLKTPTAPQSGVVNWVRDANGNPVPQVSN